MLSGKEINGMNTIYQLNVRNRERNTNEYCSYNTELEIHNNNPFLFSSHSHHCQNMMRCQRKRHYGMNCHHYCSDWCTWIWFIGVVARVVVVGYIRVGAAR